MKNLLCLSIAYALCACAGAAPQAATTPSAETRASLEAYVRDELAHLGQGHFNHLAQSACEDAVLFDFGEGGAPVIARGRSEVTALLAQHEAMLTAPGSNSSLTVDRLDCRVDGGPGFCTMELTQTLSMGGMTMGPAKLRVTLVAKQHEQRWIWTHWHVSMGAAPSAPAMAAPPAPEAPAAAAETPVPPGPAAPAAPPPAPEPPSKKK